MFLLVFLFYFVDNRFILRADFQSVLRSLSALMFASLTNRGKSMFKK